MPSSWTNEKHVQFLNTMEASFVCSMIENKGRLARLDRYMPDTSDSTLDLNKTKKTKKHNTPGPVRKMDGGAVRRTRRLPSQPIITSHQLDQVVPQFEIAIVGERRLYELASQKYQNKNVAGG